MQEITTEELKEIELSILRFVADFCDSRGITYYLSGGTLLGAIRHNGFIPWDDDIDIMLMRNDYERLIREFPSHPYYKVVDNRIDPSYPFAFATVNDTRTFKKEVKIRERFTRDLCVNVDVFPIDTLPSSKGEREDYYKRIDRQGHWLQCATWKFGKGTGIWGTIRKNLGILTFRIGEFLGFFHAKQIVEDFRKLACRYAGTESPWCGITAIAHYGSKEANLRSGYGIRKVTFEHLKLNAPAGYDAYLSQLYGKDYMSVPPIEKRVTHHASKCFWR